MSLYNDKLTEMAVTNIQGGGRSLIPPSYTDIIRTHQEGYANNANVVVNMIITNLKTLDDYQNIAGELVKLKGVVGIGEYYPQKLLVEYNKYQIGLNHIVSNISKLGYRHINRF